jgi:hypothetical protein
MTITPEERQTILDLAKKAEACKLHYDRALNATGEDFADVVRDNLLWCCGKDILPQSVVTGFADDEEYSVREVVARYSRDPETLLALARRKEYFVGYRLAMNPHTPVEALKIVAKSDDRYLRRLAKRHQSMPKKWIKRFVILLEDIWANI